MKECIHEANIDCIVETGRYDNREIYYKLMKAKAGLNRVRTSI